MLFMQSGAIFINRELRLGRWEGGGSEEGAGSWLASGSSVLWEGGGGGTGVP